MKGQSAEAAVGGIMPQDAAGHIKHDKGGSILMMLPPPVFRLKFFFQVFIILYLTLQKRRKL